MDNVRGGGRHTRNSGKEDRDNRKLMENILHYHIVRDQISYKDFYNTEILQSELRENGLGDKYQKIKVSEFAGQFYLNYFTLVSRDEIRAENGNVFAIENILTPPRNLEETIETLSCTFSSFFVAAEKSEMLKKIEDERELTIFVPINEAWKQLGIQNLVHLFSPSGEKDLKRIVQYHIGRDVIYSTSFMKDQKYRIKTLLRGEEIEIQSHELCQGCERKERNQSDKWVFSINKGESRVISNYADVFAENGVIHSINSVLIPSDVKLPYAIESSI
ncbi:hypothetical protein HK096_008694 [Nowakowskiella sp. JEL0078]|nr:hypothetical protein HK096_008694 [Nowakowskiella sp. JEL0078]